MPAGVARRCYVYYRVQEAHLAAAVAAVRLLQAALRRQHPTLQAELLRRPEATAGEVTLMEVYAHADEAVLSRVEAEAQRALARWLASARHVEVFDSLDP